MASSLISLAPSASTLSRYFETIRLPNTLGLLPTLPSVISLLWGSIPRTARKILCLGNEFVPISKAGTTKKNAMGSYEVLERDFDWNVIFARETTMSLKSLRCI